MMGKIVGALAVLLAGGAVYMGSCFLCIANHNSVSEAEYARMARLLPALAHLPAPVGGGAVRLDRFSPNFEQADRFGFDQVRPIPPYSYCSRGWWSIVVSA